MASRVGTVLQGRAGDEVPECETGDGYHYLPWVDCICAGVPCQDVSVAGKRAGLKGERTGLFYEFARLLRELRPTWFVFENVPGLLSSNDGRDFAEVLRVLMVECGYGVSWRVLDSQFFGVAQRRSRLFIVGYFGKPCPAEILFEPESVQGSASQGREKRQDIAVPLTSDSRVRSNAPGRRMEDNAGQQGHIVVAGALQSHSKRHGHAMSTQQAAESGQIIAAPITASYGKQPDSSDRNGGPPNIITQDVRGGTRDKTNHGQGIGIRVGGPCYTLSATEQHGVLGAAPDTNGVRDFAGIPKGMDSPRYRALGNAVTRNVAEWIGRRILEAEERLRA